MTPAEFIARWQHASGTELANAQSFVRELAELLDLPPPNPAREDTRDNDYVFERRVIFHHGDGKAPKAASTATSAAISCSKPRRSEHGAQTKGFDDAMLRARGQAEGYARALPADGRPAALHRRSTSASASNSTPNSPAAAPPTPRSPTRARTASSSPTSPTRPSAPASRPSGPTRTASTRAAPPARVTREIAEQLAGVAKSLEAAGNAPRARRRLSHALPVHHVRRRRRPAPQAAPSPTCSKTLSRTPDQFVPLVGALWQEMDSGGFSVVLRADPAALQRQAVQESPDVLPLTRDQIDLLLEAAQRRLDATSNRPSSAPCSNAPSTPPSATTSAPTTRRAPTSNASSCPPSSSRCASDWHNVQAAALLLANEGKLKAAALAEIRAFHHQLCHTRVLDPACGTGNFLYVTLEHMKRLEGEVLDTFAQTLATRQQRLEVEGLTVDPHQFLGLEINPRAAAIAELVLWIGYLQWHFRTRGSGLPPSPILRDFQNIECRDAVLAYDAVELRHRRSRPAASPAGTAARPNRTPSPAKPCPTKPPAVPLERYTEPAPGRLAAGRLHRRQSALHRHRRHARRRSATATSKPCAPPGRTCRNRPISSCTGGTTPPT